MDDIIPVNSMPYINNFNLKNNDTPKNRRWNLVTFWETTETGQLKSGTAISCTTLKRLLE